MTSIERRAYVLHVPTDTFYDPEFWKDFYRWERTFWEDTDMLYTIGHQANYAAARETYGDKILKLEGGYAFQTIEDAQAEIDRLGHTDEWGVFGLDANWEGDTVAVKGEPWRMLVRDVPLIFLLEGDQS